MKKCVNCGVELEDNALFCGECGTKQPAEAKKCSQCGAELPDNAKFCFQCGTPVSVTPASAPAAQQSTNTNSDVVVSQPDGDTIAITIKGVSFNLKLVEGREYGTNGEILDFYMGETPVTQALWMAVTGENPSKNNENLQYPVTDLNDSLITSFFIKLQKLTGVKFELPSKKQWRYAYEGGNKSKGYSYAGSDKQSEVGWTDRKLHPVGELYPNELGLYDMDGNVREYWLDGGYSNEFNHSPDERGIRIVVNVPVEETINPTTPLQTIIANYISERARIKAEEDAKRKAEEAERARIKAEKEAKRKAEKEVRARIEAKHPEFEVEDFSEGFAVVKSDDKYGYIKSDGSWLVKPKFDDAFDFCEGLAVVQLGDKRGYIKSDGSWLVKPKFDDAFDFCEGLAVVQLGYKYGYIKSDGNLLVKPKFDDAEDFSEGFAVVGATLQYGYIKSDGSWLVEPKFDGACDFSEGFAIVRLGYKYGYIKSDGSWLVEPKFDGAEDFCEGFARVKVGGKYGYIKSDGSWFDGCEKLE